MKKVLQYILFGCVIAVLYPLSLIFWRNDSSPNPEWEEEKFL